MRSPAPKVTYKHAFKETARQDPYRSQTKPAGTPRCPQCGASSVRGRWVAKERMKLPIPNSVRKLTCPACRQLKERYALGVVELKGASWKKKRDEVFRMVQNTEKIARNRNDQQRVLWTNEGGVLTKIYVTLPELARSIGRMLEKAFHGRSSYRRSSEEPYLRVSWEPEDLLVGEIRSKGKKPRR